MSVRDHRLSAFVLALGLAFGLALTAVDASAEDAIPAPAGRTWTDPPDRSTAASPAAGRDDAKPKDERRAETANTPETAGQSPKATAQSVKDRRSAARGAKAGPAARQAASRQPARRVAVARQGTRPVVARSQALRATRERNWTVRAYRPSYAEAPGIRYGYTSEDIPAYRPAGALDERTLRLRQVREAREAGYLVVRASDLRALPNRPFEIRREPDDQDDPEE